MVLHVHREVPLAAPQRDALRNRPARERAGSLEAEVVVEATRGMSLDDEARKPALSRALAEGLGRLGRPAPAPVLVEAHLWIVAINATLSSPTSLRFRLFPAQKGFLPRG
jgi:hypothetical protein